MAKAMKICVCALSLFLAATAIQAAWAMSPSNGIALQTETYCKGLFGLACQFAGSAREGTRPVQQGQQGRLLAFER